MVDDLTKKRVKCPGLWERIVSADEAASLVRSGMHIATGGSLSSGYPISFFKALSGRSDTVLIGPNSPGLITAEECSIGFFPGDSSSWS